MFLEFFFPNKDTITSRWSRLTPEEFFSKTDIKSNKITESRTVCLTSLDVNLSIQETVSSNVINQILEEPDWNKFLDLAQGMMQLDAAH